MSAIDDRLQAANITLPEASAPAANYIPWTKAGDLVFTAGQLPLENGKLASTGRLGEDLDTAEGAAAARQCAINILAQLKAAAGDLGRIEKLVKLTVFVASAPHFTEQHLVANGASDLLAEILGKAGRHARSAVGTASLPLNAPVEIEAVALIK